MKPVLMSNEIARWQSAGGRYVVSLFRDDTGYFYRTDGACGYLGKLSPEDALTEMEKRVCYLQADKNKTPMRRVYSQK